MRIVEVEFFAARRVVLEGAGPHAVIHQQVWLLEGAMELTQGGHMHRLEASDCLAMRVDGPVEFRKRAAEREAAFEAKSLLVLDTATGGDAERLYERLGWQRCGVIPDYALWPNGGRCATTTFFKSLVS